MLRSVSWKQYALAQTCARTRRTCKSEGCSGCQLSKAKMHRGAILRVMDGMTVSWRLGQLPACIAAWPREFAKSLFGGVFCPGNAKTNKHNNTLSLNWRANQECDVGPDSSSRTIRAQSCISNADGWEMILFWGPWLALGFCQSQWLAVSYWCPVYVEIKYWFRIFNL